MRLIFDQESPQEASYCFIWFHIERSLQPTSVGYFFFSTNEKTLCCRRKKRPILFESITTISPGQNTPVPALNHSIYSTTGVSDLINMRFTLVDHP